jgi:hypothetical protein
MPMTMTLVDSDRKPVANYNPQDPQWWITSFNPFRPNVDATDLMAMYIVDFSGSKGMFDALRNQKNSSDYWIFDPDSYTAMLHFGFCEELYAN